MIKLRAPEPKDVDLLFIWENDPGLYEVLPAAAPLSRHQMWEYVNNYNADPYATNQLRLIIEDEDGATVGYLDMFEFDPVNRRAGMAIYIGEEYRGRRFATMAIEQFAQYCGSTLALHQLWAIVAVDNMPSRTLFTGCGFKACGRLRSWIRRRNQYSDAMIYQKLFA